MLTLEDIQSIRHAIHDEIAKAANDRTLARIAEMSEPAAGPVDIDRRIRDLELKAYLAEARDESVAIESRIRTLEARVTLLEKPAGTDPR